MEPSWTSTATTFTDASAPVQLTGAGANAGDLAVPFLRPRFRHPSIWRLGGGNVRLGGIEQPAWWPAKRRQQRVRTIITGSGASRVRRTLSTAGEPWRRSAAPRARPMRAHPVSQSQSQSQSQSSPGRMASASLPSPPHPAGTGGVRRSPLDHVTHRPRPSLNQEMRPAGVRLQRTRDGQPLWSSTLSILLLLRLKKLTEGARSRQGQCPAGQAPIAFISTVWTGAGRPGPCRPFGTAGVPGSFGSIGKTS